MAGVGARAPGKAMGSSWCSTAVFRARSAIQYRQKLEETVRLLLGVRPNEPYVENEFSFEIGAAFRSTRLAS
jgi:hypothetical protein